MHACVLIDPGIIKLCISVDFIQKFGIDTIPLEESLSVKIVNQELIFMDQVCPSFEVTIRKQLSKVDLIHFKLGEFDVIFWMEWLTSYDAQINCGRKCPGVDNEKRVNVKG